MKLYVASVDFDQAFDMVARPFHAAVIVIIVLSRTGINGKMLKILRGNQMLVSKHVSGAVGVNLDYIEYL